MKKLWRFLSSMKFGMLLLGILILACVLGSLIPQGNTLDWYLQHYSQRTAALIVGTCFDDVFHCTWFLVLAVILCGNLLLCNLLRLPQLAGRWRRAADPEQVQDLPAAVTLEGISDPETAAAALRMSKPLRQQTGNGTRLYWVQNRIGVWGAWVCHLGILLLIVGFVLGQSTKEEYTVYGVPGQTKPVGDTGCSLTIDDFRAELQQSGTPDQYTTDLTLRTPEGETESARVRVNEPASLFGYKVYQNSTGSAAKLSVLRDGEVLQEQVLCAGDYLVIEDTPVAVFFDGYDPAGQFEDGQTRPVYDYALYDMSRDVMSDGRWQLEGEAAVTTSVYELRFSEAQSFTLLQLKKDSWTWLVLAGGLVTLLGLILAFYLPTRQLLAEQQPDGAWTLKGWSRKGGALFADRVRRAAGRTDS